MYTRTRRPITSRPSHRRISTRGAYTHKATSTRIATSHRRVSTRGAHRLTVHDNNTYARPAESHQVTAESVYAAHIHTRRPVHASRKSPPNHDSLRTNYVPKLTMVYERDLGVTHDWNGTLRTGNPVRSDLVTQYMAFIREEQKKAGVEASQAPVMLHSHLTASIVHMTPHIRCTQDSYDKVVFARNIALFTVAAYNTLKRGDGLSRTFTQRISRLPNEWNFLFNFQWRKTAPITS